MVWAYEVPIFDIIFLTGLRLAKRPVFQQVKCVPRHFPRDRLKNATVRVISDIHWKLPKQRRFCIFKFLFSSIIAFVCLGQCCPAALAPFRVKCWKCRINLHVTRF